VAAGLVQIVTREITAVLVSWKDGDDLREALRSLESARRRIPAGGVRAGAVVVDNGGSGISADDVDALFAGARLIANETNRGFAAAANQGAAAAEGDAILFLNPDTRAEDEPFTPIARAFDADPSVAAIAPRLLDASGPEAPKPGAIRLAPPGAEDQATFQLRRLPTLAADARELLLLDHAWPNNAWRRRARYADVDRSRAFPAEQAAAAALAVRREAFARVGGFDERFSPAWHEDVDLCARLAREGRILYLPEARFRHAGGRAADALGYARFLPIFYANALRYRAKHYGTAARLAYRPLLAAGMVLRLFALPLRRDVPRSRRDAAVAYLRVLALSLGLGSRLTAYGSRP
jgi:N-acetylglucosaminyl-diphospho-decaprenol L-rhamnosyltransferase